jgi:hypothetical protein
MDAEATIIDRQVARIRAKQKEKQNTRRKWQNARRKG